MLKEFIQHIQETTSPQVKEIDGAHYIIRADGYEQIENKVYQLFPVRLTSLDAMVKMVRTEAIKAEAGRSPLYISVPSHTHVTCFNQFYSSHFARDTYYEATATDVPGWDEKVTMGFEEAQIALRTRFQHTPDTDYALKLLSEISCGAKVVYNDNGIATTVSTQKGIALQTNDTIRPLLTLRPYRTFQEVEQPESIFLIRISDRGITFTEADGGMWKLQARDTVKKYFDEAFSKEIEDGSVVVML